MLTGTRLLLQRLIHDASPQIRAPGYRATQDNGRYLPESTAFLEAQNAGPAAKSATKSAPKASKNPVGMLFHHGLARSTIAFWVTSFTGLLLVYGLNTWLPQIMREAGYELGAALALL